MKGGTEKLEIFFEDKRGQSEKKHIKIIFFSVQPFIVKTQFEVWKYLPYKIFLPKYLSYRLRNSFHLAPTFFKLLYLLFIFYIAEEEQKCVLSVQSQLVSQIHIESESVPIHPNILSEIIGLHKNEGRGGNLARISNWQLYIGMAA